MKSVKLVKFIIFVIIFNFLLLSFVNAKDQIFTSIEPISYLVERIAGDYIEVSTLIGNGKDPHTFSPTPGQLTKLRKSRIFFTVGAPFEKAIVDKIKRLKSVKVIDLTKKLPEKFQNNYHSGHYQGHHHDGEELDPHIWLSFFVLRRIIDEIEMAISEILADKTKRLKIEKNKKELIDYLEKTHKIVKSILGKHSGRTILVYHPAFGHFLEEHNIKQIAIEHHGKVPSPGHLTKLIKKVQKTKIQVIFAQPQFNQKAANTVAQAIGARIVIINPLERNIIDNLLKMAHTVNKALR